MLLLFKLLIFRYQKCEKLGKKEDFSIFLDKVKPLPWQQKYKNQRFTYLPIPSNSMKLLI